jgi:hypothetical protein
VQGHPDLILQTAVIAALLHDIGVLAQRASDTAGPTTGHAPLAAAFVAERAPAAFRAASTAILAHHRPDDRLSRLVAAADMLAAGGPDDEESGRPILQRRSPFAQLTLGLPEQAPPRSATFFSVGPLPTDLESLTPRLAPVERDEVRRRLLALAEMVATEHTAASSPDFTAYVHGLLDLIWRAGLLVPAPAREPANDISLAAHLHVTGALAACLAADAVADDQLSAIVADVRAVADAPVAVMVAGQLRRGLSRPDDSLTLAAIQARSFLESVLTDAVADWLVEALAVSPAARLAVGPDSFFLLAPRAAEERLAAARRELERRLLDGGGQYRLDLAATPVTGHEVTSGIGSAVERLHRELDERSARPFGALGAVELNRLFSAREPNDEEEATSLAAFATELATASYLLVETIPNLSEAPPAQRLLAAFGRRVTPLSSPPIADLSGDVTRARLERFGVTGPHDPAARAWALRQQAPVALVSRPPLLLVAERERSDAFLAIDLDFSRELWSAGYATAPLARLVDGMRLLRHFLEIAGPEAASRQASRPVAVVNSSADGIVCSGAADELPRVGFALAQGLGALTGEHPAVRLSAAVGDGVGSPDAQLRAVITAMARGAKRRRRGRGPARIGRDKAALTFLGATVGWDEFRPVWERFNRLTDLITKRGVSPRLLAIARAGEGAVGHGAWTWRATAALRALAQQGQLPEVDVINLTNELARPESAARLALAARWAEQALRKSHSGGAR